MNVAFPWPPAQLSPNSRVHWAVKSRSAKSYRQTCWALAKQSFLQVDWKGPVIVSMEFLPKTKRRRDLDNLIASMKAGLDGLADALHVDDSRFELRARLSDSIGGFVRVTVGRGP